VKFEGSCNAASVGQATCGFDKEYYMWSGVIQAGVVRYLDTDVVLASTGKPATIKRRYALEVPEKAQAAMDAGEAAPVVIHLHGGGGCMESEYYVSGWADVAENNSIVMVYPQGIDTDQVVDTIGGGCCGFASWNAGNCCGMAMQENIDDGAFLLKIVDFLAKDPKLNIDTSRIYLSGHSVGSAGAQSIAAKHPNTFAAVGTFSLFLTEDGFKDGVTLDRGMPIINIHGMNDGEVPYSRDDASTWWTFDENGKVVGYASQDMAADRRQSLDFQLTTLDENNSGGIGFYTADGEVQDAMSNIKRWAGINGCKGDTPVKNNTWSATYEASGVALAAEEYTFSDCNDGAAVKLIGLPGVAHLPGAGQGETDYNTNQMLWDFMKTYSVKQEEQKDTSPKSPDAKAGSAGLFSGIFAVAAMAFALL
jgi:poly(3-hydroxybutyrate) depolymerase